MLTLFRTLFVGAMMAVGGSAAFAQIAGDDLPINAVDGERLAAIAQAHIAEMEAGALAPDQRSNTDGKAFADTPLADHTQGHATLSNDISAPSARGRAGKLTLQPADQQHLEMAHKMSAQPE
jgi:predicted outer membrane protein